MISPKLAIACALFALGVGEARAQTRTVVIDAGHGGHDRGGVPGQRVSEKTLTLDLAQRLKSVLQKSGYRVIMTRTSDVFLPLGRRTAIANSYRGATFVSLHFNSARRAGANGIETYYYRGDSAALAASIHRNVVAVATTENRGIRRRGYFVLRRTSNPGVLLEAGFLTNPSEARNALSSVYRQKLAEAIARGIRRQPAPFSRPLTPGARASRDVLAQSASGPDFVRALPRPRRASKRSKISRKKKTATKGKKSSSTRKKKTSGSAKKKAGG